MTILPQIKPANVSKSQSASAQQSAAQQQQQQQSSIASDQSGAATSHNHNLSIPFQPQAAAINANYPFAVSHSLSGDQLNVVGSVNSVSSSASTSSTSSSSSASASTSGAPSASASATKRRHVSPTHRNPGMSQRKRPSTSANVASTSGLQSAIFSVGTLPTSFANMTLPQNAMAISSGASCAPLNVCGPIAATAGQNEPNAIATTSTDQPSSPCNSEDEYFQEPEEVDEEAERLFELAMRKKGFEIRQTQPDGACFFRAVAAQIFGDEEMHDQVRRYVCDYMLANREHYAQFVAEDFARYVARKRRPDCHANYLELQAVSELFNRPIEVYQYSVTPINVFHANYQTDNDAIRVSYHRKRHYNAVIDPYKATIGVGLGLPGLQPGLAEKNLMNSAMNVSEKYHIEETMLKDKLRETDWERTERELYSQITRESYLQFVREAEQRRGTTASSATASCSSASSSKAKPAIGARSPSYSGLASTSGAFTSPRNAGVSTMQESSSSNSVFQPPAAPYHPSAAASSLDHATGSVAPFGPVSRRRATRLGPQKDAHSVFGFGRTDCSAAQSDSDETASTCSDHSSQSATSQQRAARRARRNSSQQQQAAFATRTTLTGIPEPTSSAPPPPPPPPAPLSIAADKANERDTVSKAGMRDSISPTSRSLQITDVQFQSSPFGGRNSNRSPGQTVAANDEDIDDLIFAQVLAQSEQEYFDNFRARASRVDDAERSSVIGGPSTSKDR